MSKTDAGAMRARSAELMKSRARKNSYTQGGNRVYFFGKPDNDPGNTAQKGYSDCSSAVRAAIRAAAGIDIGSNTNAQVRNRGNALIVDQTDGYYPDESKLKPGDCLYFKGNTSHTLDVGHVEMYTGDNECYGHGSGTGPTRKNLRDYCKSRATSRRRYFMALRWIFDDEEGEVDLSDSTLGARLIKLRSPRMTGSDVRDLQRILIELGFDVGSYGADGEYGAATAAAVKAFQRTVSGLEVDGEYGPLTHAALMAAASAQEGEPPTDEPDEPESPEEPEDAQEPTVEITGGSVYVRKGPDTGYGWTTVAQRGQTYAHIATARNGWLCIKIGDGTGWVSDRYARLV